MLKKIAIIAAGVAVLAGSIAYSKAKESKVDAKPNLPLVTANGNADKSGTQAAAKQSNQYWLGVRCVAPVPEMIRAHVEVPGDRGVFVAAVVPKGPAAKAGIQRHDIILAVGDKPLKEVADLIAAVGKSNGEKLTLKILRGGKQQDVTLTPKKRPAEFDSKGPVAMPPGSKWEKLGKLFDQSRPGKDGRPPLRMRFMHPGMILPPLPPGMTVTVTRKGNEPAKIIVKKGDKSWELTPDDVDKLPIDVRPHVQRMLGGKLKMAAPAEIEKSAQDRIQKQIDAMNRQMKKLEQMAEDLRRQRSLLTEPTKPKPDPKEPAGSEQKTNK